MYRVADPGVKVKRKIAYASTVDHSLASKHSGRSRRSSSSKRSSRSNRNKDSEFTTTRTARQNRNGKSEYLAQRRKGTKVKNNCHFNRREKSFSDPSHFARDDRPCPSLGAPSNRLRTCLARVNPRLGGLRATEQFAQATPTFKDSSTKDTKNNLTAKGKEREKGRVLTPPFFSRQGRRL